MRNPFSLPHRVDPREPLDPLHRPGEEEDHLYLEMDRTKESLREFQRSFGEHPDLSSRGWLVIAEGGDGTGKTALINQCVYWVKQELERADLAPAIVDLRPDAREVDPTEVRMQGVSRRLASHLQAKGLLRNSDQFMSFRDVPRDVYSSLAEYLVDSVVVIALLPRSYVGEELVEYAGLTRARLMFFAETTELGEATATALKKSAAGAGLRVPTALRLGPLAATHGQAFLDSRMRLSGLTDELPQPPKAIMKSIMTSRPISIGELQRLLYAMYADLLGQEAADRKITYQYMVKFLFRYLRETRD